MNPNNISDQLSSSRGQTRRQVLKSLGAGAVGLAGLQMLPRTARAAAQVSDADVLQFALNLEYLEAEYYLYGVTGQGLPPNDITGSGMLGNTIVKPNSRVQFQNPLFQDYAQELASDEKAHVEYLRAALLSLGVEPVARPELDLYNSFNTLAQAARIGSSFDPFENEVNFLLGGFIFEDVGVTAYRGGVSLLSSIEIAFEAAGVLGTEAYHAANLRAQIVGLGEPAITIAAQISDLRDALDGRQDDDQPPYLNGMANIVPNDGNGLVYARTTRQVLNIVYGARGAHKGLFFPNGLNGAVR